MLAETSVRDNNSRNFRPWSLKPHMEIGFLPLDRVCVLDGPRVELVWGGKLLPEYSRRAGATLPHRARQVQGGALNSSNRTRAPIWRLVGNRSEERRVGKEGR